jgi:dipeptidase E
MIQNRRLLLLSTSTRHGHGYLDHAAEAILAHFAGARRIAFVPYALSDVDGYTATATARFARWDIEAVGVHTAADPVALLARCDGIFVGGGNTFRLTTALYRTGLREAIRSAVADGLPYLGASAGTVVACPTIKTTNDMPIVQPPSFDALGLVGFQINPHYLNAKLSATHMGETRDTRLTEYTEDNAVPVVGVPEGSWVRADPATVILDGEDDGMLFRSGSASAAVAVGTSLADLEQPC